LTDEDIRKNYELYGHPDGKQSFSIGIALPHFLVTEGNGKFVLLFYGALLGVLMPYLVGSWWYGTQRMTKENILLSSSGKLFKEYKEDLNSNSVVSILSSGDEFAEARGANAASSGLSTVEKNVLADDVTLKLGREDRSKLQDLDDEIRRKTLALLWAYLGRIDLGDDTLNEGKDGNTVRITQVLTTIVEKFESAAIAQKLNEAYLTMLPTWGNAQPLIAAYNTTKGLIQAVAPGGSPLMQLPYFTPSIARAVQEATGSKNMTIQAFMSIPEVERRTLVVGQGLLDEKEYQFATSIASKLPYAKVETAFFKVTGEKHVTPGSLIQLVVKLRVIPPGTSSIPDVNEKDLLDIDPTEGDLDALRVSKKEEDTSIQPPLAHAPYFPRDHAPSWRVFLSEPRSGKIAVPPFKFQTFDKPIFEADGCTPTFNVVTLKAQFQAPPQAAEYPFRMHFICDSYLGFDESMDITMKVEDVVKAEEVEEDDGEISEPDEDSLAGQMNALRGGEPKKTRRIKPEIEVEEDDDDDDESGTDGEESSGSDDDTDTDTDEE
jgi:translocation protein SEC63